MNSFIGGLLIGLAAFMLFLTLGRIMGVSGICSQLLKLESFKENKWRLFFFLGMLAGGILLKIFKPESFYLEPLNYIHYIIAGLLVGFGTLLGNGCTSGHGVCGISRFSTRSIVATLVFILFGIIGVLLSHLLTGAL